MKSISLFLFVGVLLFADSRSCTERYTATYNPTRSSNRVGVCADRIMLADLQASEAICKKYCQGGGGVDEACDLSMYYGALRPQLMDLQGQMRHQINCKI